MFPKVSYFSGGREDTACRVTNVHGRTDFPDGIGASLFQQGVQSETVSSRQPAILQFGEISPIFRSIRFICIQCIQFQHPA